MQDHETIKHALNMLINDDELYYGATPAYGAILQKRYGLTERQATEVCYRLFAIAKYMSKTKKFNSR